MSVPDVSPLVMSVSVKSPLKERVLIIHSDPAVKMPITEPCGCIWGHPGDSNWSSCSSENMGPKAFCLGPFGVVLLLGLTTPVHAQASSDTLRQQSESESERVEERGVNRTEIEKEREGEDWAGEEGYDGNCSTAERRSGPFGVLSGARFKCAVLSWGMLC